jgi:hypothetical protein
VATDRTREGIRRFNLSHGNPTGHQETITLAWIAVIVRCLAEHDHGQPLSVLAGGWLEECGDRGYLRRFHSEALLMSDEARQGWVPPDLRPFEERIMTAADVSYTLEPDLDAEEFIDV